MLFFQEDRAVLLEGNTCLSHSKENQALFSDPLSSALIARLQLRYFFFRQPPRGKNAHARTAMQNSVGLTCFSKVPTPLKRPPRLANRQSFTLESQKKIRLQNQLRKS